jgi:hypothetical protein
MLVMAHVLMLLTDTGAIFAKRSCFFNRLKEFLLDFQRRGCTLRLWLQLWLSVSQLANHKPCPTRLSFAALQDSTRPL